MRQNCPVCMEFLFDSRRTAQAMRCGHFIHSDCFRELRRAPGGFSTLRCPVCSVSLTDFEFLWRQLDEEVALTPMPPEYANMMVRILCNDCHAEGETNFHIVGLKCKACGSYNTRQIAGADGGAELAEEEV